MSWYRAVVSRDARFDGVVFVGVTTTGIYCRPVCTAPTPLRDRSVFFRNAAEAEREGFRACFRCRPELAPGSATVDASARLASLATRQIEEGADDMEALAVSLGVSSRHLRRVLASELGVSPVELLQSRRAGLARQLLLETTLPVTEVAFASGFSSVRRFNTVIRARFDRSPTELRQTRRARKDGLTLRLDYRPPLDWDVLLAFLGARAIPGVESVVDGAYRRTIRLDTHTGWISVRHDDARDALACEISLSLAPVVLGVVRRVRHLFDLDANPTLIARHLARDRMLAPLVRRARGQRLPGCFDGFEMAVRAILGQQVSVKGATTTAGRIAERYGSPFETPFEDLERLFPSPDALVRARSLGVPAARARAISALAKAVRDGDVSLAPAADIDRTLDALRALPGVGDWTAQYLAMRALAWPDAFPATDLHVRNALGDDAAERAESWRPWRAYGVMHLWRHHAEQDPRSSARRHRARRAR